MLLSTPLSMAGHARSSMHIQVGPTAVLIARTCVCICIWMEECTHVLRAHVDVREGWSSGASACVCIRLHIHPSSGFTFIVNASYACMLLQSSKVQLPTPSRERLSLAEKQKKCAGEVSNKSGTRRTVQKTNRALAVCRCTKQNAS